MALAGQASRLCRRGRIRLRHYFITRFQNVPKWLERDFITIIVLGEVIEIRVNHLVYVLKHALFYEQYQMRRMLEESIDNLLASAERAFNLASEPISQNAF